MNTNQNVGRMALSAAVVVFASLSQASPVQRAVMPALSPDGSTLAISYQGDIWTLPAGGGRATRVTVHPGKDLLPRWTPDGKQITFTSDRYGSQEIMVMNADGTNIRRLTNDSGAKYPVSISPDGKTIYGYTTAWGRSDSFKLRIDGGEPIRITGNVFELEYFPAPTKDGKIVFCSGGSAGTWRKPEYQGSNSGEIWIADNGVPLTNMRKLTDNEFADLFPMPAPDGSIYFVSNRSGWPNLWRMGRDGSKPTQLTQFKDGTLRWPNMSVDGRKIAFEFESDLYVYDVASKATSKITVDIPDDSRRNPEQLVSVSNSVRGYAVAPDGKKTLMVARGDLYLMPEKGGTGRRLTTSIAMDEMPVWLDPNTILFTTGRTGKRELWTVTTKGEEAVWYADAKDVGNAALSPDGKSVIFYRGDRELMISDAKGKNARVLAADAFERAYAGGGESASWAPDSKWVVLARTTDRGGSNICLVSTEGKPEIVVARLARDVTTPHFLPNGKGIFFTANEFSDADLFLVDLVPAEPRYEEDELDNIIEGKTPEPKKDAPKVEVYEPGLEDRLRRLTTTGAAQPWASEDSRTLYVTTQTGLIAVSVATGAAMPVPGIAGAGDPTIVKGKTYFLALGKLNAMAPGQPPAPVNFSGEVILNLRDEEKALFDEIWWAMDRFYYDPKMNNKDWPGIKAKFAKIMPSVADREDFYALMGEMMEELNSSHLGATAPTLPSDANDRPITTAWLGVEWDWAKLDASDQYVVAKVLPGSPADNPASLLKTGDRLVSVNGAKLTGQNLSQLLTNQAGKRIKLSVERNGKTVDVTLRAASPAGRSGLATAAWVKSRKEIVDKLSGGKIAYHYYPSMDQTSQDEFLRAIRRDTQGKQAVILDVRYNGGGSTAQQALGVLIKRPWLIRTRRDFPELKLSENIYRGDSLELPSALMINQYSFSNAEILAEGFKRLKVGPVVGERTAGGVIGTSAWPLWDGGLIRMPASGAYGIEGDNLEGNGRKPDIRVLWDPNAELEGRDVQLEAAIKELLKRIGK